MLPEGRQQADMVVNPCTSKDVANRSELADEPSACPILSPQGDIQLAVKVSWHASYGLQMSGDRSLYMDPIKETRFELLL